MSESEQALVLSVMEMFIGMFDTQNKLIQELKDEINRLKGEQGKPDIAAKNQKEQEESSEESDTGSKDKQGDISSEKERKTTKKTRKKRKVKFDKTRRIDEKKTIDIEDKSKLPWDAEFKGYATSYYQDLEIKARLIELNRATYYSASTGKTYTAPLPNDYQQGHDYTQQTKGHIIMLKFGFGMSVPTIGNFLRMSGIDISNATISNIILSNGEELKQERDAIHDNGLAAGLYTQTDTTASRVNGENQHAHIFGNEYYTAYFTMPHKDRQTILDLLRCGQPRVYLLNEDTFGIYNYLKIGKKIQECLGAISGEQLWDEQSFINHIKTVLTAGQYQRHGQKILEGAYLTAYQADNPLNILVCDDAPQYKLLALLIALCWVHMGRHFKKLNPTIKHHQQLLEDFLTRFWQFYHRLKAYQKAPAPIQATQLSVEFDQLFSRITGFEQLDQRIAKTKAKKNQLLVVLKHPYVPLHNNDSELAAKKEIRLRDISFQTRVPKGTLAKDVFFTIIQTCKKLGVNAYAYMLDKLTETKMIPLPQLIIQKANQL